MSKKTVEISRYYNRETSWLEFNRRVMDEISYSKNPCLEKVKFLSIFYSNLDEFFMVRVAGKINAVRERIAPTDSPDKLPGKVVLKNIRKKCLEILNDYYDAYHNILIPELKNNNISIINFSDTNRIQSDFLVHYFDNYVFPILTPLAVDPSHPFPFLSNLGLYLAITFDENQFEQFDDTPKIAFVEIPHILPRLIQLPSEEDSFEFILLEDLIKANLDKLFFGLKSENAYPVRITRDLDISLLENDIVDLLQSIKTEVKTREQSEAVRIEISQNAPDILINYLLNELNLNSTDVYKINGPLGLRDFMSLYDLPIDELKYPEFNPRIPPQIIEKKKIFSILREQDLLIHHPYESFYTVLDFLNTAANDKNVLAIKQTLYRTSGDSPIINTLIQAAENGKQVTAVVELKARFDEKNNIIWARRMERAGVNVVYGIIGLKTHAKTSLIVRKEKNRITRYVHLSTGNYNSSTAKVYADLGYLTSNNDIAQDISTLFNILTGFNIFSAGKLKEGFTPPKFKSLFLAPLELRDSFSKLIDEEIRNQKENQNGSIIAKMNALVDQEIIEKLYEASAAGVSIKLLVRGICCLIPNLKGVSENIEVRSIVGRFLEHSRFYVFGNNNNPKVYLGSADWMPRNMDRRIEIVFPVEDEQAKARILSEIIPTYWNDSIKSKVLNNKGTYDKPDPDPSMPQSAHDKFIETARKIGIKSVPYDKAIKESLKLGKRPILIK